MLHAFRQQRTVNAAAGQQGDKSEALKQEIGEVAGRWGVTAGKVRVFLLLGAAMTSAE